MVSPLHSVAYTYAYEPEGSTDQRDLMPIIDNKINGATDSLSTYAYNYDELGRRDDRTQSGTAISTSTDEFDYNDRSEVIGSTNSDTNLGAAWNPDYTYDQIGNRKSSTGFQPVAAYATNQLNQYVEPTTLESAHDEDGNLETKGNWTYTWNNENRLSNATNSSTSASIDFTYDYQGRLVKKDDGTNVEIYAYNGWNRIATFDATVPSNFTLQTSYLWGTDLSGTQQGAGGVGGLLKEGDLYPTYDANGNIMQKLDGTGATVMNVAYDPFGNIISSGTLVGEYGFSTKPLIDGLDWYYYGFRYYDPVTGRWLSRDPLGEFGGVNVYGMMGNDGVNSIDLLGLIKIYYGVDEKAKGFIYGRIDPATRDFIRDENGAVNWFDFEDRIDDFESALNSALDRCRKAFPDENFPDLSFELIDSGVVVGIPNGGWNATKQFRRGKTEDDIAWKQIRESSPPGAPVVLFTRTHQGTGLHSTTAAWASPGEMFMPVDGDPSDFVHEFGHVSGYTNPNAPKGANSSHHHEDGNIMAGKNGKGPNQSSISGNKMTVCYCRSIFDAYGKK